MPLITPFNRWNLNKGIKDQALCIWVLHNHRMELRHVGAVTVTDAINHKFPLLVS